MDDFAALHAGVEHRMIGLIEGAKGLFSEGEKAEIIAMLDVAEYGIGLETMAGIIVEENKHIDINLLREINSLAAEMQLRDEPFMGQLNSFFETKAAPLAS